MSTSSIYSSNKLKQVLLNNTQHFIMKSFLSAKFEYDRQVSEYHLYWYNSKKGIFESDPRYKCLSNKQMNKREVAYFLSIMKDYKESQNNSDGIVWENKKLGFNKSKVKVQQLTMELK